MEKNIFTTLLFKLNYSFSPSLFMMVDNVKQIFKNYNSFISFSMKESTRSFIRILLLFFLFNFSSLMNAPILDVINNSPWPKIIAIAYREKGCFPFHKNLVFNLDDKKSIDIGNVDCFEFSILEKPSDLGKSSQTGLIGRFTVLDSENVSVTMSYQSAWSIMAVGVEEKRDQSCWG